MLQNAYFLAKIGADTAENEQHFAEILPKTGKMVVAALRSPLTRSFGRSRSVFDLLTDVENVRGVANSPAHTVRTS